MPILNRQSCQKLERFRETVKGRTVIIDKTNVDLLIFGKSNE